MEIIFVDDGSDDDTNQILNTEIPNHTTIKLLRLSRNFGQTAAFQAGIDFSKGDVIIPMDGDLQNDPKDIPRLIEKLQEGFDVVSGWRQHRKDGFVRKNLSSVANWFISKFLV